MTKLKSMLGHARCLSLAIGLAACVAQPVEPPTDDSTSELTGPSSSAIPQAVESCAGHGFCVATPQVCHQRGGSLLPFGNCDDGNPVCCSR